MSDDSEEPYDAREVEHATEMYVESVRSNFPHILEEHHVHDMKVFYSRMMRACIVPPTSVILAFVFLKRVFNSVPLNKHGQLPLDLTSIYRCMLFALLISSKMLEDTPFANKYWRDMAERNCHVGDRDITCLTLEEFNNMEREFLTRINFELWIGDQDLPIVKGIVQHWDIWRTASKEKK